MKPLLESDGWVIWATRARTLFEFGHPVAPVFTDPSFPALQYPLLLPGLEAVAFRFMGGSTARSCTCSCSASRSRSSAGLGAAARAHAAVLLAATLLAVVTAPVFLFQLETNFADIPVAMLIGLGLASLAAWLRTGAAGCCRRRRSSSARAR